METPVPNCWNGYVAFSQAVRRRPAIRGKIENGSCAGLPVLGLGISISYFAPSAAAFADVILEGRNEPTMALPSVAVIHPVPINDGHATSRQARQISISFMAANVRLPGSPETGTREARSPVRKIMVAAAVMR